MIRIDSVSKHFDEVKSLSDISLNVSKGSIFGLIGSNGSGKSTLLRIIAGIYRQDNGDVFIDGNNVWENDSVKERMVYLSDEQYFIPHGTLYDMMKLYKSVYRSFSCERYSEYLKLFNLDENRKISTFSKGMQKQASFLLGLACGCDILLCDETLDGLDPVMRQTVRRIVASEVAERDLTVVFASHNLKELEDICDHVALLHKGEMLLEAELDDMKLGMHKVQMSFTPEKADIVNDALKELETLSVERRGSLFTVITRGEAKDIESRFNAFDPLFIEFIPLTLEEIFIAEMEEKGYEFHESIS